MRQALATVIRLFPKPAVSQPEAAPLLPTLDDTELLAAVRLGDASAATAFYRRVRPTVERTLFKLLGRRDCDHDDLVQTTIIAVVQSIPQFRAECSLDTWSSRIATRSVFRMLRRRTTERRIFAQPSDATDKDAEEVATQTYGATAAQIGARDVIARIRVHLSEMNEAKAWTVLLHDVAGHDLREIAEIMSCSVAAAQSRLARGRAELHERIENDPELARRLEPIEEP